MKVLEINTSSFQRLGITIHLLNYYRHIDSTTIQADFIANRNVDNELVNLFESLGFHVFSLSSRDHKPVQYCIDLIKLIRRNKYDIVRVHGSSSLMAIEMLAAFLGGCKIRITHSHNTKTEHNTIHMLLKPFLYMFTNVYYSCGQDAGRFLYGKRKFTVIPNAIDISEYRFDENVRNQIRQSFSINDKIVVGHVGNINSQKNHQFLIKIMAELMKKSNKYVLICVGAGDCSELEEEAVHLGIADRIQFLGQHKDVPALLNAFDIMCLPSLYEGFPLVTVEWQAAGLEALLSDSVTKEVCITDLVHYRNLEDGAAKWAEDILAYSKRKIDRKYYNVLVSQSDYSIIKAASELVDGFEELARNGVKANANDGRA